MSRSQSLRNGSMVLVACLISACLISGSALGQVIINEVDADTPGTDDREFLEIHDGGAGNTGLTGLVVVLFSGADDLSYAAFDLDGFATGADGYFVLCGNAANTPNCDLDVTPDTDLIQNGADAVALYAGDSTDFPVGTAVTTVGLIDAIVYDTNDADDSGLLPLLNAGQPQVNEDGAGDKDRDSNQRCPNGAGGARNTDNYRQSVPTPGADNVGANCPVAFGSCGDSATLIHDVQGSGYASPLAGAIGVIVEGVVVGDFQDATTELGGVFVQEEGADADGDPSTSEGLFVYLDGLGPDVVVGDVVRVQGRVREFSDLTELTDVSSFAVCASGQAVTASDVALPITAAAELERYEGMSIDIAQTLYVADTFNQGRFGEVGLSVGGRLFAPTGVAAPGADALALADLNLRSQIQLDDGNSTQRPLPLPPYLGDDNTMRAGDTIPGLAGILSQSFGVYEVLPVGPLPFTRVNGREAVPPAVGGTVKVASFNVSNYFTTLDDSGPICGPLADLDCRGADTAAELTRQRTKLIEALIGLDADILGLIEIENSASTTVQDLVDGLNAVAGSGTYDFVDTGTIGVDAIKQAFIYRPANASADGPFAILDATVDPTFLDTKNRPTLAQTFESNATGERFTVAVNHFKSKGSACDDVGDPDVGDGQSNCNLTRTLAANALVNWLATDPTGSGDPDFLIIGDLNSYAMEDPITAIESSGYTNLIDHYEGASAYTYLIFGEAGYLDHALANASLAPKVAGLAIWHINADEPTALNYEDFNQPGLYNPDSFRSSDHDPVLLGLSADSDGDGIPDGYDPDTIAMVVVGLPLGVFANSSDPNGQRNAMLNRLENIKREIEDGETDDAIQHLQDLRRRVDGCSDLPMVGEGPDVNDWIVDCDPQREVRALIDLLITNLGAVADPSAATL